MRDERVNSPDLCLLRRYGRGMRIRRHAAAGLALIIITACGGEAEDIESGGATTENAAANSPAGAKPNKKEAVKEKVVPVIKNDEDPRYVVEPTGTIRNDEYADGVRGTVTIRAKRGDSESNRGPVPKGLLALADGTSVACAKFRSTVWSDFDQFEDPDLICESKVDVAQAMKFTITK